MLILLRRDGPMIFLYRQPRFKIWDISPRVFFEKKFLLIVEYQRKWHPCHHNLRTLQIWRWNDDSKSRNSLILNSDDTSKLPAFPKNLPANGLTFFFPFGGDEKEITAHWSNYLLLYGPRLSWCIGYRPFIIPLYFCHIFLIRCYFQGGSNAYFACAFVTFLF